MIPINICNETCILCRQEGINIKSADGPDYSTEYSNIKSFSSELETVVISRKQREIKNP